MEEQTSQVEGNEAQQNDEQEEAAVLAAIKESRGESVSPDPVPESPQAAEGFQQGSQQDETEPAQAEEVKAQAVLAGMTEDQIKELLAKAGEVDDLKAQLRNVFGRFGDLNSRLQQMQKTADQEPAAAHEAGKLKDIARQYHEAVLDGDMEKADELFVKSLHMMPRQSAQDDGADGRFDDALTQQEKKFETKLVKMHHKDFDAICKSPDFALWLKTLPPEDQQTLQTSWDSEYITPKIDEFKTWREKSAKSNTQQQQQRNRRLENAVTPSGSASAKPPAMTEEEATLLAIRQRRRPHMAAT